MVCRIVMCTPIWSSVSLSPLTVRNIEMGLLFFTGRRTRLIVYGRTVSRTSVTCVFRCSPFPLSLIPMVRLSSRWLMRRLRVVTRLVIPFVIWYRVGSRVRGLRLELRVRVASNIIVVISTIIRAQSRRGLVMLRWVVLWAWIVTMRVPLLRRVSIVMRIRVRMTIITGRLFCTPCLMRMERRVVVRSRRPVRVIAVVSFMVYPLCLCRLTLIMIVLRLCIRIVIRLTLICVRPLRRRTCFTPRTRSRYMVTRRRVVCYMERKRVWGYFRVTLPVLSRVPLLRRRLACFRL